MQNAIERYLETLLSFIPRDAVEGRANKDYATLIYIPAVGAERVYRITLDRLCPQFTTARYRETVWEYVEKESRARPSVDLLTSDVATDHPVFEYLNGECFGQCENCPDGYAGQDYVLMMWRVGGRKSTVECWDPLCRESGMWPSVVGAFAALSGQCEYAANHLELTSN